MKKLAVLTILSLLISLNAGSQIRLGLRGGISTAYFNARDIVVPNEYRIETIDNANIGFHGGFMAQVSFFGVFLQPELLLSTVGNEVRVSDLRENGAVEQIREQRFTKLDFPILAGMRFGPARLGIGPVGTIMLYTDSELEDHPQIQERYRNATFGYQVGAGLDFSVFALDLKYEGNLTRLGSSMVVAGQERDFDARSRQVILSVGIFF
jgi:hypothetical protein